MAPWPMQPHLNKQQIGKISVRTSLAILVIWFAILGIALSQRRQILDYLALRGYSAPSAIATLATQDGMTENARHVFYVNKPTIESKITFGKKCPAGMAEKTIVLGCYHSNQAGIVLLSVDDPRLNGVVQVTAAHEMLHAEYDRLSTNDRNYVDGLLLDYYKNKLTNQRIKDTIDGYRKSEPNDVVNEMHSIFGTEVANLPPALETYYQRYFTDRSKVTGFAAQYETEFSSRQDAIKQDDAQLAALKKQIDNLEKSLSTQQAEISQQRSTLDAERSSGNITAYNAGVPGYNQQVNTYNAGVHQVQALVDQYNQIVVARNAVAAEITTLSNALSSQATTIN
ncbi:MAG: hypothetical protein JWN38_390 [Candidatus Saccharibacteria bacterium]|nr:hypothetical protein [Candidatus Saccharibacteria bacterium]